MTSDADGGAPADSEALQRVDLDEGALYSVVRNAVEDALLDVIGTLLLVGVGFVLVVAGGQALVRASSALGVAEGVALVAVGFSVAAAALDLVSPVTDWL